MTNPSPAPTPTIEPSTAEPGNPPSLPELSEALLDPATLDQLFRDLAACTEVLEVLAKRAAQEHVGTATAGTARLSLTEARDLLRQERVRGVQIRYRYHDADWLDTLLVHPSGVRLVRIQTS